MMQHTNPQTPSDCDAVLELIPAYAAGATDPAETAFVEARLASCPEAAAELETYRQLLDEARESVAEIEPPAQLRASLAARLADHASRGGAPSAAPAKGGSADRLDGAQDKSERDWRRMIFSVRVAYTAAAAALLLFVLTNIYWSSRVDDLETRNTQLTALLEARDSGPQLASLTNAVTRRLEGTSEDSPAYALIVWTPESRAGLLYVEGVPPLPQDRVYQFWLRRGDDLFSAGLFTVDETGRGTLFFNSPDSEALDTFEQAGITAEPSGGSPGPTTQPVIAGRLT